MKKLHLETEQNKSVLILELSMILKNILPNGILIRNIMKANAIIINQIYDKGYSVMDILAGQLFYNSLKRTVKY